MSIQNINEFIRKWEWNFGLQLRCMQSFTVFFTAKKAITWPTKVFAPALVQKNSKPRSKMDTWTVFTCYYTYWSAVKLLPLFLSVKIYYTAGHHLTGGNTKWWSNCKRLLSHTAQEKLALGSPRWLVGCHHAQNGLIHRKMVVDCPIPVTRISNGWWEVVFDTRLTRPCQRRRKHLLLRKGKVSWKK